MEYLELVKFSKEYFDTIEMQIKEEYGIELSDYKESEWEKFHSEVVSGIISKNIKRVKSRRDLIEWYSLTPYTTVVYIHSEKELKKVLKCKTVEDILYEVESLLFQIMLSYYVMKDDIRTSYFLFMGYSIDDEQCEYEDTANFTSKLSSDKYLPIELKNKIPHYLEDFKNIIYRESVITVFDCFKNPRDITRYGYKKTKMAVDMIKEQGDIKNLFLLDWVEGISLTNTIFKNIEGNINVVKDDLLELSRLLAEIDFVHGRNEIARLLFRYIKCKEYNSRLIRGMQDLVKNNIEHFNRCYHDIQKVVNWYDWGRDEYICSYSQMEKELELDWGEYLYDKRIEAKLCKVPDGRIFKQKIKNDPQELYARIHQAVMKGIWKEKDKRSVQKK